MDQERHPNRSKLDFLYHEVLGEVADLVQRIEGVNVRQAVTVSDLGKLASRLDESSKSLTDLPANLGLQVQQSLESGSQRLQTELQLCVKQTLATTQDHLQSLARDSAQYARIAHQSARRLAMVTMVTGAIAGMVGGMLAGIALARYLG